MAVLRRPAGGELRVARLYEYYFPTPDERRQTGAWWVRQLRGEYFPEVSLDHPAFRELLEREGWRPASPAR